MDDLINRLESWKFADAHELSKNLSLTHTQHEVIRCLLASYGNCEWFGQEAGRLISSVINMLCRNLKGG